MDTCAQGVSGLAVPYPTPIFRFLHIDNLSVVLQREGLHAPNQTPDDGLTYRTIHDASVQQKRSCQPISCGPRGVIHDYVSFYFGVLSPMLLKLKTGQVAGYTDGQSPLIYLVTSAQAVTESGVGFVFSDGHGLAAFTTWFDDLSRLDRLDWSMINQRYWSDNINDMDRQRRKQAELLVHRFCPWGLIREIGVIDANMQSSVRRVLGQFPERLHRPVAVRPAWYF